MDRSDQYKNNGKTQDDLRRSRIDQSLTLRKEKREDLQTKRRRHLSGSQISNDTSSTVDEAQLGEIVAMAKSPDLAVCRPAMRQIRKLAASGKSPPIDDIIALGVLPILIEHLQSENSELQYEATWVLTNIASGTSQQTHAVIEAGAVPKILKLLSSTDSNVCDQALWLFANIVGDSCDTRDYCLQAGLTQFIPRFTRPECPLSLLRNIAWLLTNIFRRKDPPVGTSVADFLLPSMITLIRYADNEIVMNTIWALAYLSENGKKHIQMIVNSGAVPCIVALLSRSEPKLHTAVLRLLGNIIVGTNEQTQSVLDCGLLGMLQPFLNRSHERNAKEATWIISNVCAGSKQQIQSVIQAGLFEAIIGMLDHNGRQVRKEALHAVENIAHNGTPDQVLHLMRLGVMEPLCRSLGETEPGFLQVTLDGILGILQKSGDFAKEVCEKIEELGALDKIEELQDHPHRLVYAPAFKIIDDFFVDDDGIMLDDHSAFKFDDPTTFDAPTNFDL